MNQGNTRTEKKITWDLHKITPCWKAEINPRLDRKPTPTPRSTQIGTEAKTEAHPEQNHPMLEARDQPTPTPRSTHTQIGTETTWQTHPRQTETQIAAETKTQTHEQTETQTHEQTQPHR